MNFNVGTAAYISTLPQVDSSFMGAEVGTGTVVLKIDSYSVPVRYLLLYLKHLLK